MNVDHPHLIRIAGRNTHAATKWCYHPQMHSLYRHTYVRFNAAHIGDTQHMLIVTNRVVPRMHQVNMHARSVTPVR